MARPIFASRRSQNEQAKFLALVAYLGGGQNREGMCEMDLWGRYEHKSWKQLVVLSLD